MDQNDRAAIEGLFGKLANVEAQGSARDPEAEAFIRERIARQPGAPYLMAQTIVVQEQALEAAQARIEALEADLDAQEQPAAGGGGFFGGLFGGGAPARPTRRASPIPRTAPPAGAMPQGRPGGGFLAGAAQTAMGVAGGVLLANTVSGMFGADAAQAEEGLDEPLAPEEELAQAPEEDLDGGDFGEDF